MRVLVTGASGFVGSYVVRRLLEIDGVDVIASSTNMQKAKTFEWFEKVRYVEYNISEPKSSLFEFFGKPDVLIHLAWNDYRSHKEMFQIEKNLPENYNFIKELAKDVKNINAIGTSFEYGQQNGCLSEEIDTKPTLASSLAKDSLRKFLQELNKSVDFRLKWIRPFYVYGEGQHPKSLFGQLDSAIENGEKIFNMSKGEQIRDYLKVKEMADRIVKISLQTSITDIVNCASGKPISVRSLVEEYIKEKKAKIELNFGHYPYLEYEPMAFWSDGTKMEKALNAYSLERK